VPTAQPGVASSTRAVAAAIATLACSMLPGRGPEQVPPGAWGGEHAALEVTATGALAEFDCAHAVIDEPLRLQDDRFSVAGAYVPERGGPQREEPEIHHPARFAGILEGDRLTFSVQLTDQGLDVGTFSVVRGAQARVLKCLTAG
jgi:hypothetical protein